MSSAENFIQTTNHLNIQLSKQVDCNVKILGFTKYIYYYSKFAKDHIL